MPEFLMPLSDAEFPEPVARDYKGIPVMIENPVGSIREGVDMDGNFWSVEMKVDYGFIEDTISMEGEDEGLDCFVRFDVDSDWVFICRQKTKEGNLDEEKVYLGFRTQGEVQRVYAEHYNTRQFLGQIEVMALADFVNFLDMYHRPRAERRARDMEVEDNAPRIAPPQFSGAAFDQSHTGVDNRIGTGSGIQVQKSVGFDGQERQLVNMAEEPELVVDGMNKFVEFTEVNSEGQPVSTMFMGPTKKVGNQEFPAEAFAVIIDFESPDLWMINMWESIEARETVASVRRAVQEFAEARLSPDFRDVARRRLIEAWKRVMPMEPVPAILV